MIAIVVGGADAAESNFLAAAALCDQAQVKTEIFLINDQIEWFARATPQHAVSLHPNKHKLATWLINRCARELPMPARVWSWQPLANVVTDIAEHYGGQSNGLASGSSGLYAVKIALDLGFQKILLCGVPMDASANHFIRHRRWYEAAGFQRTWTKRLPLIQPYVRSLSGGWTENMLGSPSLEWLTDNLSPHPMETAQCSSSIACATSP